jgi:hypothetical protein
VLPSIPESAPINFTVDVLWAEAVRIEIMSQTPVAARTAKIDVRAFISVSVFYR